MSGADTTNSRSSIYKANYTGRLYVRYSKSTRSPYVLNDNSLEADSKHTHTHMSTHVHSPLFTDMARHESL